jgi:predicted Zn-dependent protease
LLESSPFDFRAHLDFAKNAPDPGAARNSARVVLANAETGPLREEAAKLLGADHASASQPPLVERDAVGLQVVIVPLNRADIGLLSEAAALFQTITEIPAQIRRLPTELRFENPERQRGAADIRAAIVNKYGPTDFSGWTAREYEEALSKDVPDLSAYARSALRFRLARMEQEPGQFDASVYLDKFCALLAPVRARDPKVIYVGVTDADIFAGDANYLFSFRGWQEQDFCSIASYAMMTARRAGDSHESRKRLVQRLAKELVPASLGGLKIPRATDPSDPYSYADGIRRLDEKSLELSQPTRDAIAAAR